MRVFLDIGSHIGETVLEVRKPKYGFERIVCFEPASVCLLALKALAAEDRRIEVCPFGLGAKNERLELHNPGTLGASILSQGPSETVEIMDAAQWFRANLSPDDFLVVKTNCEGAEVEIINRLLDEGLFDWAVTFLITFDIREFAEHRHKETELRHRLKATGLTNYCFSDDVMIGLTHEDRIAHWLGLVGIDRGHDRQTTERLYAAAFRKYANRTGRRERFEVILKERFGYSALPEPLKDALRFAKRVTGLTRERRA